MSIPPPPVARRPLRRRALRWLVAFLLVYLGIVALFWSLERHLVFIPTSAATEWLPPVDERSREVVFTSADGNTIHGRWIPPDTPERGAVLIFNGNGGNLTHRGRLAADLRKALGIGVLLFDYPGYGKNSGTPTEAGCYAAGEAAYKWLTDEQQVSPTRIILCGESLGGGPAVELATRLEHRALVLIYTFTSLPAVAKYRFPFLPVYTMMRTRFDNLSKIERCNRPIFFVHGTTDRFIPFNHSEQLYAAANEPKYFARLVGYDHNMLHADPFIDDLKAFLDRHAPLD